MSTEPFVREPGWDYIVTAEDRRKFHPELAGDEYNNGKEWIRVQYAEDNEAFGTKLIYRRRQLAPSPAQWVALAERRPTGSDAPYLVAKNGEIVGWCWKNTDGTSLPVQGTHWLPIPAPPREPTQEELDEAAWKAWSDADTSNGRYFTQERRAFLAGIAQARASKGATAG